MDYPEDVTIMTPSSGVSSLIDTIRTLKIADFKNIYLCLDNDEAGQKVVRSLLDTYPFMIDKTPKPSKGKDIADLYKELVYDKQR